MNLEMYIFKMYIHNVYILFCEAALWYQLNWVKWNFPQLEYLKQAEIYNNALYLYKPHS